MKLSQIAEYLKGELKGDGNIEIASLAKVESAEKGDITFISNPKYKKYLDSSKASAVVVDHKTGSIDLPHIIVKDAYMGFLFLLKLFEKSKLYSFNGISDKAFIAESAKCSANVSVAPSAYIGENVSIGENSIIYPGVIIMDNVAIGSDCTLYPNVSIREECVIGNNVTLHNGVVIGSDGFGFAPNGDSYEKIPQIGNVIIEDNVEIGANTVIDRATLGNTVIKKGVKLDNLIQIAHNCEIGENTVMAAQTGVAGSTIIGKNVTTGGQTAISGHVKVGDKVTAAGRTGITKDIPEKSIVMGLPALPIMQSKRIDVSVRHLPETVKRVSKLENELIELKKRLEDLGKKER
jgi:UDP-3-O-[3-hydroxymyristoyl] glucosamine N-acyltransferase